MYPRCEIENLLNGAPNSNPGVRWEGAPPAEFFPGFILPNSYDFVNSILFSRRILQHGQTFSSW